MAEGGALANAGTEAVAPGVKKLSQQVSVAIVGPCRRHVTVTIPRADIDEELNLAVQELINTVKVPGFRPGRVPRVLVEKKFREEVTSGVRQNLLMKSLEQVAEDNDLDAINEPDFDIESLTIPDEGDFTYEFDVEVRPEFELPEYKGLTLDRPIHATSDEDVAKFKTRYLKQFGELVPEEGAVAPGHIVRVNISATWNGQELVRPSEDRLTVQPTLRFQDGEVAGFDTLMTGAKIGDVREANVTISMEAARVEMRGETVVVKFEVLDVRSIRTPEVDQEFVERMGLESPEAFDKFLRDTLGRQNEWEQRQATRRKLLDKITESATWDLPETLVRRQVDNALRREVLEMQQAGFTDEEISARRNELLQKQITMTRQALKEHFVLDRIADTEKVEVVPEDLEFEIAMMAYRRNESPRKMRARLQKQGLMENLVAQILERKTVDLLLESAQFNDVPAEPEVESAIESIPLALCGESLGSAQAMND
jgi:trigger factor